MSRLAEIKKTLPRGCQILAVSKLQAATKIRELHGEGQIAFAENYAQEGIQKQGELEGLGLDWHFIGSLQKKKAKDVVGRFSLIHSVDSFELAEVLNRRALASGLRQKILCQLNLANEETKGGFTEAGFSTVFSELRTLQNLEICGLMTMPPLFADPERARPYFQKLKSLRDHYSGQLGSCRELSMGTSSDYLVAASEGATWVRLGTVLFGERGGRT